MANRALGGAVVERSLTAFLDGEDSLGIENIIHSTAGAARYGFSGPLVGGVTVYAWAVGALVEALGADWMELGWVEFQLRRPVYPGERITTRVEPAEPSDRGGVSFAMTKGDGEVAVRGTAGLGIAEFYDAITSAANRAPQPRPAERPPLTMEHLPIGGDMPAMAIDLSQVEAEAYADEFARDADPRWRGPRGRVHPAWIALRVNRLLEHSWRYTAAIHASSQIQHLAAVRPEQRLVVSGRIPTAYERRGHQYAVLDVTLTAADGQELARMRQPTIYAPAMR